MRGLLGLLTALTAAGACGADLQGSLGLSSDNVFRGLSLSDGQPSLLADVHAVGLHWFGGLAASSVRLEPRESLAAQVIGYLGYQRQLDVDSSLSLSARHYDYPGDAHRAVYEYQEFSAAFTWRQLLTLQLIGSPDTYQAAGYRRYGRGAALAVELGGHVPLPRAFAASAGVGYYDLDRQVGVGYVYWSAGVSRPWNRWSFSLSYIGTDARAHRLFGSLAGQRVVAGALWSF